MLKRKKRGQSTMEYAMLLVIVLGAFVATSNYIKRGLQGRWKDTVDGLGDQYDPRTANTDLRHSLSSFTQTQIISLGTSNNNGIWTMRKDFTNSTERKTGYLSVGGY